jgi:hypothetical protein
MNSRAVLINLKWMDSSGSAEYSPQGYLHSPTNYQGMMAWYTDLERYLEDTQVHKQGQRWAINPHKIIAASSNSGRESLLEMDNDQVETTDPTSVFQIFNLPMIVY